MAQELVDASIKSLSQDRSARFLRDHYVSLKQDSESAYRNNKFQMNNVEFSPSIESTIDVALGLHCSPEQLEKYLQKLNVAIHDLDEKRVQDLILGGAKELKDSFANVDSSKKGSNVTALRLKQNKPLED
ncbi:MAG: hypothetical protein ACJAVI_006087 [Candidatus Azotimanducaceae bacterium]